MFAGALAPVPGGKGFAITILWANSDIKIPIRKFLIFIMKQTTLKFKKTYN